MPTFLSSYLSGIERGASPAHGHSPAMGASADTSATQVRAMSRTRCRAPCILQSTPCTRRTLCSAPSMRTSPARTSSARTGRARNPDVASCPTPCSQRVSQLELERHRSEIVELEHQLEVESERMVNQLNKEKAALAKEAAALKEKLQQVRLAVPTPAH